MAEKDDSREDEAARSGGGGKREDLDAERTRLYRHHRTAGTLEVYFSMYPLDRPRNYGLTPEQLASAEERQIRHRDQATGNER